MGELNTLEPIFGTVLTTYFSKIVMNFQKG